MISKLYIELSSLCNLTCKMCFRHSWLDETPMLMSDPLVDRVCEAIAACDAETVFFGGMGEPLLHPRLFELLAYARAHGKRTELITNATLLDGAVCDKLLSAGLDTLWVSMDGFTEASYEAVRRGSLYRTVTAHLRRFNQRRTETRLGIAFVMMKENLSELDAINGFADDYRVDLLNLSHIIPTSPLPEKDAIYHLPYPVGKMHRLDRTQAYTRERDTCPFLRDKVVFIRADGEVVPCMQLLHSSHTYLYEEKRTVRAHSFGNLADAPLSELLCRPDYTAFRARVEAFLFPCCTDCMGCEDRLENRTDCMYNEAPTCGACLWAQGYGRCP